MPTRDKSKQELIHRIQDSCIYRVHRCLAFSRIKLTLPSQISDNDWCRTVSTSVEIITKVQNQT
jgi:hypothetical protein